MIKLKVFQDESLYEREEYICGEHTSQKKDKEKESMVFVKEWQHLTDVSCWLEED